MRNISFSLTTPQIIARTKTVTRRLGWLNVKVGDRLQGCEKCMGRRHGEPLVRLAVIEVVDVRREPLNRLTLELFYGIREVQLEGFTYSFEKRKWAAAFVQMFCRVNKCEPGRTITRIEFRYVYRQCRVCQTELRVVRGDICATCESRESRRAQLLTADTGFDMKNIARFLGSAIG